MVRRVLKVFGGVCIGDGPGIASRGKVQGKEQVGR